MLYYFLYQLIYKQYGGTTESLFYKGLNVFQYVTFRTTWATISALLISLLFGGRVIKKLQEMKIGQEIREELSEEHHAKRGTPTMGGVLILGSVFISTILWARLDSIYLWLALAATTAFGLVGFVDDYIKIVKKRSLGLTERQKLVGQFVTAVVVWGVLFFTTGDSLFRGHEFRDLNRFVVKLNQNRNPVSQYLQGQFSPETKQLLTDYDAAKAPALQKALTTDLNRVLNDPNFYDEQRFNAAYLPEEERIKLTDETKKMIEKRPTQGDALVRFNRRLLQDAYPEEISRVGGFSWNVSIPFFKDTAFTDPLVAVTYIGPYIYLLFIVFTLLGASNAVNLTDGMDGLASSVTFIAMSALTALTYVASDGRWAAYLDITHKPEAAELTVFCGAMVGASLGFLWYNSPPAQVFMGDVGSLAIGGALGTVAILTKQEFLLPFIGGVFIIEAASVMLQVGYFKFTKKTKGQGKRIFLQAPLHHHFQIAGLKEPKIVFRFVIVAILFALMSLSTLKLR
ncbi:MAG: phospho-N-acetylmuramoyl-pentapeptide-transferase [Acidobacteria bacterium]|nr:phospho-N-acetylmuramoyl-pentapeptide-transferase [Acidobacteriota bacterium]